MIKTVQDLIDELMKVEDKTKRVYVYTEGGEACGDQDIAPLHSIDHDLSDRVDINLIIS